MQSQVYLEVGRITKTHGINGQLKVQPWCDSPDILLDFKTLYIKDKEVKIDNAKRYKDSVLFSICGVDTLDKAQKFIGSIIYVERSKFPIKEGSYFIKDLIGMKVYDALNEDKYYGIIKNVLQPGANDVYEIEDNEKNTILIPAIKDVIKKVDINSNRMEIKPLKGMFDED